MRSSWLRDLSVALVLLASGVYSALTYAHAITAVTEELPPYNMTVDGELTGMGTEVVKAVLEEAGEDVRIRSMPWARAYDIALNNENVLIYSIARTPQREPLFKWVGVIAPTRWFLFSLPGTEFDLKTLDDARQYQIATVKADVGEQYLIDKGFAVGRNLQSSNKYEHNYQKLKAGRVDLWISNELNAHYLVRQASGDPNEAAVPQLSLDDLGGADGLCMAFSRDTPDEVVERFRQALARVRADGRYDAIVAKWLK
ncbi:MAG: amino acid ABC transporter substrate-binding protein [Pseudomonas sp. BICA1-14]|uniref:substrate-binding periplasmic protein n=1 Tax=Stutzerimonas kunmingensis TaxID=1211807 RepID=UPI0005B47B88|nr:MULTISPECIES: transporter substrate-binding domain-containing protein [Stutzerimonas stutzeri group]KJS75966.1 MAG: amino acid ABC transporter substrate-binding protein [[Pseudomonas] sp. BICA1-14]HBW07660.1 amino acid ABC transporter substrate-binding protein [Pseudomonas sp.]